MSLPLQINCIIIQTSQSCS